MLPNRMQLNKTVEEQLKRIKATTGITPNVASRIAFFRSFESDFYFDPTINYKLNGTLILDKFTWLGKTQLVAELLLKQRYPQLDGKKLQTAWAMHVEHGLGSLKSFRNIVNCLESITK